MDLIDLARLDERRQARGLAIVADESRPFAGGVAGRGTPGSWVNNAVGMGLDSEVEAAELDDLIEWYGAVGAEPRLEVSPFVHESLLRLLEERRFVIRAFENVFYRELDPGTPVGTVHAPPTGLTVEIVDRHDAKAIREAAAVAMSGFFPPGTGPQESDFAVAERGMRHERTVTVVARLDGQAVGAGSMEVAGEVCALFGLSVLEPYRRQGVQQALIAARLNEAARQGARIATISSRPGVATERNVRRMGFQLGYTKPVLVQPGPGRTPVLT